MTRDFDRYGETVKVCHKDARLFIKNPESYTAEIELGGVHQHVTLSQEYVDEQLG